MINIPDILKSSLKSCFESCFSKQFISITFHSHSNNTPEKFDCQLLDKQINYCNEFLQAELTSSQFKVFKAFMELHLKHEGNLFPSLGRLASMAQCARSTVQLAIKRLQELNIIKAEYRGYRKTLRYQIHEFYINNRSKIASLVKNVAMMSLLLLMSPARLLGNRYLLKEKDDYLIKSAKFEEKNVSLQLNDSHYDEIKKHPKWIFERTLTILDKKLDQGIAIANQTNYFMVIFRQEVAKTSTKSRQLKSIPKTGTTKPVDKAKPIVYPTYKHKANLSLESDFDIAVKIGIASHTNPFTKIVADMHYKNLSESEQLKLDLMVHMDCKCRSSVGIQGSMSDNTGR